MFTALEPSPDEEGWVRRNKNSLLSPWVFAVVVK
jgi:hypothetical protein